jgi:hypothetical protein
MSNNYQASCPSLPASQGPSHPGGGRSACPALGAACLLPPARSQFQPSAVLNPGLGESYLLTFCLPCLL